MIDKYSNSTAISKKVLLKILLKIIDSENVPFTIILVMELCTLMSLNPKIQDYLKEFLSKDKKFPKQWMLKIGISLKSFVLE